MDDDLSTWSFRAFPNMNDCSPLCDHQVIYKLLTNIDGFTFSTEDEIPDGVLHLISKLLPGEGAESNATADDVADCLAHIFETCLLHIPDVSMDNLWLEALRQIGGQDLDSRDEHVSGGHVLRDLPKLFKAWGLVGRWHEKMHCTGEEAYTLEIKNTTDGVQGQVQINQTAPITQPTDDEKRGTDNSSGTGANNSEYHPRQRVRRSSEQLSGHCDCPLGCTPTYTDEVKDSNSMDDEGSLEDPTSSDVTATSNEFDVKAGSYRVENVQERTVQWLVDSHLDERMKAMDDRLTRLDSKMDAILKHLSKNHNP